MRHRYGSAATRLALAVALASLAAVAVAAPPTPSRSAPSARRRPTCGRSSSASTRASSPTGPQGRHRLRAVERAGDPAAHRRLARRHHVDRAGRSDPRHRQGRADRDRALRGAVAALCAGGEAGDQELRAISRARSSRSAAPKDITRIYVERMLAPSGVKPGEFDMVFAGATSARAAALRRRRGRCRDPAAAVQFPGRGAGLQRARPHRRLRARAAVLRHGGQPRLGERATRPCWRAFSPRTPRRSPGSRTTATAPRRSG